MNILKYLIKSCMYTNWCHTEKREENNKIQVFLQEKTYLANSMLYPIQTLWE